MPAISLKKEFDDLDLDSGTTKTNNVNVDYPNY